ncbi:MAG: helix-turn-helix domain-containing protein [Bacteroides sp.]|nr:helix-turn-helix domain-containing protein [Bacillota bacterium]MCM1394372.1 helix-turn-helix domain-containing protein [[Eubacterium] siraeum]MCM1456178.1 helix-turn-helix domain-containing protein [Bacteroides sp.]
MERIKELRVEEGISQSQLAKATGLSQSAIAAWEVGKNVINANAIITLAKYFGVTTDYLLGVSE